MATMHHSHWSKEKDLTFAKCTSRTEWRTTRVEGVIMRAVKGWQVTEEGGSTFVDSIGQEHATVGNVMGWMER